MVNRDRFYELALAFRGTEVKPHFERTAFKVSGKRIYVTIDEAATSANFKFTPEQQREFCAFDPASVSPIPNKWGEQGWTTINLRQASEELVKTALETAYGLVK